MHVQLFNLLRIVFNIRRLHMELEIEILLIHIPFTGHSSEKSQLTEVSLNVAFNNGYYVFGKLNGVV